jgi:cytidylate kinase
MSIGAYEKCKRYIEQHSKESQTKQTRQRVIYPSITISRQTGAGSKPVCENLIKMLDEYSRPEGVNWAYFDRTLIEKVLEDHRLPEQIREFMVEEKYRHISSAVYELLGLKPSNWTIIHKTSDTILQLARMGNVIIVGRGGNIITQKLKNTFHIRLIAPFEKRVEHIMKIMKMNEREAAAHIKREDDNRKQYVKSYFHADVDDPNFYHLVINTDLLTYEGTAYLIAEGVVKKFSALFPQFVHN